ncbi:MAG: hypothetical protein LBJ40_05835 [Delftia acidovorans]|jgi:hypothetical protein|uniref:hypothetical protein n=1 Tax=Delftia acidovorans TaxID=80866 RepID=UPI0028280006|nr:hypothetical protein [Delftia acidovorans]
MIDLVDDPRPYPNPIARGHVLRTGRKGLVALFEQWQEAGVNHAALGIQWTQRPPVEVLEEPAQYVLPRFPSHEGLSAVAADW